MWASQPHDLNIARVLSAMTLSCALPTWFGAEEKSLSHTVWSALLMFASNFASSAAGDSGAAVAAEDSSAASASGRTAWIMRAEPPWCSVRDTVPRNRGIRQCAFVRRQPLTRVDRARGAAAFVAFAYSLLDPVPLPRESVSRAGHVAPDP